jgi:hypothetical protein
VGVVRPEGTGPPKPPPFVKHPNADAEVRETQSNRLSSFTWLRYQRVFYGLFHFYDVANCVAYKGSSREMVITVLLIVNYL